MWHFYLINHPRWIIWSKSPGELRVEYHSFHSALSIFWVIWTEYFTVKWYHILRKYIAYLWFGSHLFLCPSAHPMYATSWIQIPWRRLKDPGSAMYVCIPRKDRNLLLATLPVNGPSSNSASPKTMLYSLRWLSWVLQWSRYRSHQGDYSAYEKQPFKLQTIWSQITLVQYRTTVLAPCVFRQESFSNWFSI